MREPIEEVRERNNQHINYIVNELVGDKIKLKRYVEDNILLELQLRFNLKKERWWVCVIVAMNILYFIIKG